jgi:hypothetical protein
MRGLQMIWMKRLNEEVNEKVGKEWEYLYMYLSAPCVSHILSHFDGCMLQMSACCWSWRLIGLHRRRHSRRPDRRPARLRHCATLTRYFGE